MNTKEVVLKARELGKCIPAFNCPHIPMVKPICEAIRDENSVAMIQVARVEWEKMSSESLERIAEEYHKYKVEGHTLLHLDHIPAVDEDFKKVDYLHLLVGGIGKGLPDPRIRFAAHVNEHIACGYFHHILNRRLVAVEVDAAFDERRDCDIVCAFGDGPHPVVFRKDGGNNGNLAGRIGARISACGHKAKEGCHQGTKHKCRYSFHNCSPL